MYETAMTLGKYAPFHRGHQLVIETALKEADNLIVVIYQARRTTDIPLSVRAGWIRTLYPEVLVLEAADGPEDTGDSLAIINLQDAFLRTFLSGRKIDAFYSSEPYGNHVSKALGCANRQVDAKRLTVPVSATKIREDPESYAEFLHPLVRADLVRRIVLLGAPSTGKTTTARALADRLGTIWCPEFGRDYWFEHQVDHRLSMDDLEIIARGQSALERRMAMGASGTLVVDTSPLTTLVYARYWFGRESPALKTALADYLALPRDYWLCEADFPFDDSPDRSGPHSRETLQALTIEALNEFGIPWRSASGCPERRIKEITE